MTPRTAVITARQVEIVRLVARGLSNDEIGDELGISSRTAKAHCDVLRGKLGVKRRREIPVAYMGLTGNSPYPRVTDLVAS